MMLKHSKHLKLLLLLCISVASFSAYAQEAIVEIENDDTLPIAPMRYDDVVEPPKNNFSSVDGKDKWERYENGELDGKAYLQLQEEYNALVAGKPEVKRKIASQRVKMMKKEKDLIKNNIVKKETRKLASASKPKREVQSKKKENLPSRLPPKKSK